MLVYDPHDDTCGLGLMVVSGYKAGLTWSILPIESRRIGAICIDMDCLRRNWDVWFAYEWNGSLRVIDINSAGILAST